MSCTSSKSLLQSSRVIYAIRNHTKRRNPHVATVSIIWKKYYDLSVNFPWTDLSLSHESWWTTPSMLFLILIARELIPAVANCCRSWQIIGTSSSCCFQNDGHYCIF